MSASVLRSLLLVTAAYLAVGLVAGAVWRFTGDNSWIEGYFCVPPALLTAFLAVVQFWFGLQVRHRFDPGGHAPRLALFLGIGSFQRGRGSPQPDLSVESALNPLVGAS